MALTKTATEVSHETEAEESASDAMERFEEAIGLATELLSRLSKLEEHVTGPSPEAESKDAIAVSRPGLVPSLNRQGARLRDVLRAAHSSVATIERALF